MPSFINPNKTLHTCKESECKNCDVADKINCHFSSKQLLGFFSIALPVMIVGAYGAFRFAPWAVLIQIALYMMYFGFVEIRVMCSHCPHYGEPEINSLKCWANYGSPTLWKYRPGPMSFGEKSVFLIGMFIVVFYPAAISLAAGLIFVPIIYLILAASAFLLLLSKLCIKCFNFACVFNRVDEKTKAQFLSHNPSFADAWNHKENN